MKQYYISNMSLNHTNNINDYINYNPNTCLNQNSPSTCLPLRFNHNTTVNCDITILQTQGSDDFLYNVDEFTKFISYANYKHEWATEAMIEKALYAMFPEYYL